MLLETGNPKSAILNPKCCYDMGAHMKTTIDIADPVFKAAREEAARTGTTIRALVEEGLRQVLKSRRGAAKRFTLRKAAFRGRGLRPELREGGWAAIRDRAYEGHGS